MSSKTIYEDDLEVVGTVTTANLTVTGTLNATADFTSVLTSTNTTASTSNTTGGVVLSGGIGISKTTDAVDSTNGGTITTAGGVAIAKKLMVGDTVIVGTDTSAITPLASTRLFIVGDTTDSPLISGIGFQRSGASINSTGINTTNEMVFSLQSAANFKFQTGQSDYNVDGIVGLNIGTAQISTAIATESSSSITGSIITAGGMGIAKKLYVGTDLSVGGNVTSGTWNGGVISATYGGTGAATLTSNAVLLGNGTGTVQSPSSITYATSTLTLPKLISNDTTDSSSSITGAVITAGGLGVAKKLYVGTNLFTGSNVGIGTTTANAPLQFANDAPNRKIVLWDGGNNDHQFYGFGINSLTLRYQVADTLNSHVFYAATSSSTSNEIGRILGTGGAQFSLIQGSTTASANLSLRSTTNATKGYVYIDETTESSSISTGALRIDGGVGIAKKLYIGGGELNLTNGTSNILNYGTTGVGAPTQTTRSTGTKIVLNSGITASTLDYAIGIESQNMWFSVPSGVGGDGFKWYTGNGVTNIMRLGSSQLNLTVATEASSSTTGAFITAGGMGIAKKLYVGTDLSVGGTVTLTSALSVANGGTGATTSTGTGAVVLANAPSLLTSLSVTNGSNSLSYNGVTASITRASGASNMSLVASTSGFAAYDAYTNSVNNAWFYSGLDGSGYFGINNSGGLIATNNSNSNKSIMIAPGNSNMMTINTTGVNIVGTTASTSNSTGILTLAGGLGISNATDATSSTNGGTITTAGGAAVAKKLYVGSDLSVAGSIMTPVIGKIKPIYIRGTGVNNLVNQLVKVGGTTHVDTSNVGLTLTIINAATHALTSTTAYDTSTSGAASTSLATALDNLDRQQICILTSYSSFTGAMNAALRTAARRLGLYKLSEVTTVSVPYCAIFKGQGTADPNTNINNQVTEYTGSASSTDDYAIINTWIIEDSISVDNLSSVLINPNPTATIPSVYVNNNGFVGINTITPSSTLSVNGTLSVTSGSNSFSFDGTQSVLSRTGAATINTISCETSSNSAYSIYRNTPDNSLFYSGLDGAGLLALNTGGGLLTTHSSNSNKSIMIAPGFANMMTINTTGVDIVGTTASTSNSTGILKLSGGLGISNATDATSSTNGGTITTAGGMGIGKQLFVGTDLTIAGSIGIGTPATIYRFDLAYNGICARFYGTHIDSTVIRYENTSAGGRTYHVGSTGTGSGAGTGYSIFDVTGSAARLLIDATGSVNIYSTTTSTSSITGALKLSGGIGISNATDATSSTNGGTITTAGGAAVAKKLYVGTDLTVSGGTRLGTTVITDGTAYLRQTTDLGITYIQSSTTEAVDSAADLKFTTRSGVTTNMTLTGSSGNLNTRGSITSQSVTDSTSTATGSIVTAGGMGIAKKLYVGTNTNTRSLTVSGVLDLADRSICGNSSHGLIYSANVGVISSHLFCNSDASTEYVKINSFTAMLEVLGISQFTGAITSTSTTTSTSSITGALKLSGGIGISNATDATSSTNGGTITTAGGAAIAKKLYVGTDLYINNVEIPRFHNGTFSGASTVSIPIYFSDTQYNYAEIKVRFILSSACNVTFAGNATEDGTGTVLATSEMAETAVKHNAQATPVYTNSSYIVNTGESAGIDNILTFRIIRAIGTSTSGDRNHYEYTTVYTWSGVGTTRLTGIGFIQNTTLGTNPVRSIKLTCSAGNISGTYSTQHSY